MITIRAMKKPSAISSIAAAMRGGARRRQNSYNPRPPRTKADRQIAQSAALGGGWALGVRRPGLFPHARSVFSPRSPFLWPPSSQLPLGTEPQAEATQCRRLSPLRYRPSLLLLAESWPTASGAPAAPAAPAAALPSSSAHEPGGRLTSSWSPKRRATTMPGSHRCYRRRRAWSRRGMTCCGSWSDRAGRGS